MRKARALVLTAGLTTGLLFSAVAPAGAEWAVKVHIILCKATTGAGLTYPGVAPAVTTTWDVHCGKDKPKPAAHIGPNIVQADVVSTDGSKPLITKPLVGSNANLNAGGFVTGNCGLSFGTSVGNYEPDDVSINGKGSITFDVDWTGVGGVLLLTGAGGKAGGPVGPFVAVVAASPDRTKGDTCTALPGADDFKIVGIAVGVGDK